MSNLIFKLPGSVAWSIIKRPKFNTISSNTVSGRGQFRIAKQQYPIWEYEFTWEYLHGYEQQGIADSTTAPSDMSELEQIMGMYLAMKGSFDSFLYSDENDNTVTNMPFAVGDGSTTSFQLTRQIGQGVDIVQNLDTSNAPPAINYPNPIIYKGNWSGTKNLVRSSNGVGDTNNGWVVQANSPDTSLPIVTLNAGFAPDGSVTASKITFQTSAANRMLVYSSSTALAPWTQSATIVAGRVFTYSVWLRSDTPGQQLHIEVGDNVYESAFSVITLTTRWTRYTITRQFQGTRNIIPDAAFLMGQAWWNQSDPAMVIQGYVGGQSGAGSIKYVGTGSSAGFKWQQSKVINVIPGQTYTFSGYMDCTNVTSGSPNWVIFDPNIQAPLIQLNGTAGAGMTRYSNNFVVPAGVSQITILADSGGCTVANGQNLIWCNPQLELGSVATAWEACSGSIQIVPLMALDPTINNGGKPYAFYAWGAQCEEGSTATTYQSTSSFNSWGPLYQNNGSRTNYVLSSQAFSNGSYWANNQLIISDNAVAAPDGTMTGCAIQGYRAINPPAAPSLSSQAGGSLGATTYYVKVTYVNALGETVASSESNLAVAANRQLIVNSPSNPLFYATGWNVYVSTSTGTETKQASNIAFGTNWTEPTTGLIAGSALPSSNTTATTDGFIYQNVASPASFNSKYMTLSVWMKVPTGSWTTDIRIRQNGATDVLQTINVTTKWQRFTVQGSLLSNLTTLSILLFGGSTINSDQIVHIWGLQFENWGPNIVGTFPWAALGNGIDGGSAYIPTTTAQVTVQDYTLSANGIVNFNAAPAANAVLSWTGSYYFRLHFADDNIDFEEFMYQLWTLKKLKCESVIL